MYTRAAHSTVRWNMEITQHTLEVSPASAYWHAPPRKRHWFIPYHEKRHWFIPKRENVTGLYPNAKTLLVSTVPRKRDWFIPKRENVTGLQHTAKTLLVYTIPLLLCCLMSSDVG